MSGVWAKTARCSLLPLLFVLVGCADDFGRDDAVAALQTTGASEVEAVCMADTLTLVDALDAADPRRQRTDGDRQALVAAANRCASLNDDDPLATESFTVDRSDSEEEPFPAGEMRSEVAAAVLTEASTADLRADSIDVLVRAGRSPVRAACVVDRLLEAGGEVVLSDPRFGAGRDPLEAAAFAGCAATE